MNFFKFYKNLYKQIYVNNPPNLTKYLIEFLKFQKFTKMSLRELDVDFGRLAWSDPIIHENKMAEPEMNKTHKKKRGEESNEADLFDASGTRIFVIGQLSICVLADGARVLCCNFGLH